MDKAMLETVRNSIDLIEAKLKIHDIKTRNEGYDWWHLTDSDRSHLMEMLEEIEKMLKMLKGEKV